MAIVWILLLIYVVWPLAFTVVTFYIIVMVRNFLSFIRLSLGYADSRRKDDVGSDGTKRMANRFAQPQLRFCLLVPYPFSLLKPRRLLASVE